MKKCIVCDAEFSPKNPKGKYCSQKCRQKDYRKKVGTFLKIAKLAKGDFSDYAKSDPNATYVPVNWNLPKKTSEVMRELTNGAVKKHEKVYLNEPDPSPDVEEIKRTIAAINAEKIPKERDTTMGRKSWRIEQENRIKALEDKLK